jgi:hypothetical protein
MLMLLKLSAIHAMKLARRQPSDMRGAPIGLLAVLLSCLAAVYVPVGLYHLVWDEHPIGAIDLRLRWQEQHYVFRQKSPFDVRDRWDAIKRGSGSNGVREPEVEPDLGVPRPGYPPWAYATGAALYWPSNWTAARYYFAGVNLILLFLLSAWAYQVGANAGTPIGRLFCAAVPATFSIHSTLGTGQYGLIVLMSLFAAMWFVERGHSVLGGILIGVALAKPSLSGPFLIPLLVKQRWVALFTSAVYLGLGSCVTWWLTDSDPVTMLKQMAGPFSLRSITEGVDPVALLSRLGVSSKTAMKVTAAVVSVVLLASTVIWRRASMLTLFGVSSVAARLWTYHRGYDDVIGIFLLMALGALAIARDSRIAKAAFLVMGLALWTPARMLGDVVGLIILIAWIGCAAVLLGVASRMAQPIAESG